MELPKHVCFKGDNGMYLSAQTIESHPYLQFSSDDIGDARVRFTTFTNTNGTVRIKSDYFGKFWRRSPNWIWADSDDETSNNPDTLFRVVKFGDTFALQNLGNNNYCKRLTTEGKVSCLNAQTATISKEAHLQIEEAVLSRRIYGVQYNLDKARKYDENVKTLVTREIVNQSSTPYKTTLTLKYSVTRGKQWDSSVSLKLGVKTTITAGVPEITSTSIEIQTEFTDSYSWGESITTTEELSDTGEVTVPPNTKKIVSVIATEASCKIPFSYKQEDVLTNGQTVVREFDDGIYTGVNSFGFYHDVKDEKL